MSRYLDDEANLIEVSRWQREALAALAALGLGVAIGFSLPLPVKTYDLVVVDVAGDAWVIEYGLTAEDCRRELSEWAILAYCE